MKISLLITFIISLVLSCGTVCQHEHTEECGKNYEKCIHECIITDSRAIELPRH